MRVLIKSVSLFTEFLNGQIWVELPEGSKVKDLLVKILPNGEYRGVKPVVIVNKEVVEEDYVLKDGDEVYLTPPFAGG